jgi:hypothetical protein
MTKGSRAIKFSHLEFKEFAKGFDENLEKHRAKTYNYTTVCTTTTVFGSVPTI